MTPENVRRWTIGPDHPDHRHAATLTPVATIASLPLATATGSPRLGADGTGATPAPASSAPSLDYHRDPDYRAAIGATHLGITKAEYLRHREAGLKYCAGHGAWHPRNTATFYPRATTPDGLDNICQEIHRRRSREYQRRLRAQRGSA